MKTIFPILLAALTFAIRSPAADTNAPASSNIASPALIKIGTLAATNYYDRMVIVTGKVVQVTIRPTVTFLNLDKKYPNSPFAIVIIHGKSSYYGDVNTLKGKSVEIRGKIKNYKDKPEIVLDSTNQLTVLGITNLSLPLNPPGASTTNFPATPSPANAPPVAPPTNGFPEIF